MQSPKNMFIKLLMRIIGPPEYYCLNCGPEEQKFWNSAPPVGAHSAWEAAKHYQSPWHAQWYVAKAFMLRKVVPLTVLILFVGCILFDLYSFINSAPEAVHSANERAQIQRFKEELIVRKKEHFDDKK